MFLVQKIKINSNSAFELHTFKMFFFLASSSSLQLCNTVIDNTLVGGLISIHGHDFIFETIGDTSHVAVEIF
jgi:hypothetical protein